MVEQAFVCCFGKADGRGEQWKRHLGGEKDRGQEEQREAGFGYSLSACSCHCLFSTTTGLPCFGTISLWGKLPPSSLTGRPGGEGVYMTLQGCGEAGVVACGEGRTHSSVKAGKHQASLFEKKSLASRRWRTGGAGSSEQAAAGRQAQATRRGLGWRGRRGLYEAGVVWWCVEPEKPGRQAQLAAAGAASQAFCGGQAWPRGVAAWRAADGVTA